MHSLIVAELLIAVGHACLKQDSLGDGIYLWSNEEDLRARYRFALIVQKLYRNATADCTRFFRRDIDVSFQFSSAPVHGGQQSLSAHAVTYVNGNIANNAGHGGTHGVIVELHLLFTNAGLQSLHVSP